MLDQAKQTIIKTFQKNIHCRMHWLCLKAILQRKSLLSILDSENVIPAAAFGPSMSITSLSAGRAKKMQRTISAISLNITMWRLLMTGRISWHLLTPSEIRQSPSQEDLTRNEAEGDYKGCPLISFGLSQFVFYD